MFSKGHIGASKSAPFWVDKLLFTPQGPLLDKNKEEDKSAEGFGLEVGVRAQKAAAGKFHWNPLVHEVFDAIERKVNGKIWQVFWA